MACLILCLMCLACLVLLSMCPACTYQSVPVVPGVLESASNLGRVVPAVPDSGPDVPGVLDPVDLATAISLGVPNGVLAAIPAVTVVPGVPGVHGVLGIAGVPNMLGMQVVYVVRLMLITLCMMTVQIVLMMMMILLKDHMNQNKRGHLSRRFPTIPMQQHKKAYVCAADVLFVVACFTLACSTHAWKYLLSILRHPVSLILLSYCFVCLIPLNPDVPTSRCQCTTTPAFAILEECTQLLKQTVNS